MPKPIDTDLQNDVEDIDFSKSTPNNELSPLHQVRAEKGLKIRISLLNHILKPKRTYYHWLKNMYRCNSGICCTSGLTRSWTCVCLALQYLSVNPDLHLLDGKLRYRIGYVGMSMAVYNMVLPIYKQFPQADLIYENLNGYSMRLGKKVPAWRSSDAAAEVEREAGKWSDGKKLAEKLGKVLTDEQWRNLISSGSVFGVDDPE